jgi:KaiC/GvpD/RAD55 family RecA-like ATPase
MDSWIVLANDDIGGHHRRGLYVLKSRGMRHSNELREFVLTDGGLDIFDGNGQFPVTSTAPAPASREGLDRHAVV